MMTYFESFKAFVKAKPSNERYDSWSQDCAIGRWAAKEFPGETIIPYFASFVRNGEKVYVSEEEDFNKIHEAVRDSKTFGELLAALEEIA
jgi:hypothetical protein